MLIKAKKKGALLAVGTYHATIISIDVKPNAEKPKKVILKFRLDGRPDEVTKETGPSFERDSTLRRDAETLLGKKLSDDEAENGFDIDILKDKKAKITVHHRGGAGGKLIASVTLIQPPDAEDAGEAVLEAAFAAPTTKPATAELQPAT